MRKSKKEPYAKRSAQDILSDPASRWSCTHFGGISEIELYVASTRQWETVATVNSAAGLDAEEIAAFIINKIANQC